MMFSAAERDRLISVWGTSARRWSLVYAWTVVMNARSIPNASFRILQIGASALAVHEALLTIRVDGVST